MKGCMGFLALNLQNVNSFMLHPSITTIAPKVMWQNCNKFDSCLGSTANLKVMIEDNSIDEYSRCLTPSQELDQMKEEFGIEVDPRWKKFLKKPIKKVKRMLRQSTESKKKIGSLILVRAGESEYASGDNPRFTGTYRYRSFLSFICIEKYYLIHLCIFFAPTRLAGWDDPPLTSKGIQQVGI